MVEIRIKLDGERECPICGYYLQLSNIKGNSGEVMTKTGGRPTHRKYTIGLICPNCNAMVTYETFNPDEIHTIIKNEQRKEWK